MRSLLAVILLLQSAALFAQDIHFSQFYHAPMNYNPALTGAFDGDYRFTGNYRTQWSSVTVPYRTFGLAADARNVLEMENVHGGFSFFHDKTGDSRFTTIVANLSGAYSTFVDADSIITVTGGMQFGITNKNIDYTDLQFDQQYNGSYYDGTLANGENFARTSRTYANLNLGGYVQWQPVKRQKIGVGLGLYNLTGPQQSFYDDPAIKLDRRLTFHIDGVAKVTEEIDVMPAIFYQRQGKFKEMIYGANFRYVLLDQLGLYRAVYLGGWGRTRDAGYITAGMDYNNITIGLSYDFNLSDLQPASNKRGGFEMHLIYIIKQVKPVKIKHIICPDYI